MGIIPKKLTTKQLIDSGSAFVLILLAIGFFSKNNTFYIVSIPALLINMTVPKFYYPFAMFWYSLSNALGFIVSRILFTVIYIVMVVPVGLLRRLMGKDSLHLTQFKKNNTSILKLRNHTFSSKDMTTPF
jgi:hypothetical protein